MTVNPVIVDPNAPLDDALWILDNYGFRHLPVVDCDRLVGILSDRDLRLATGLLPSEERAEGGERPERTVRDIMRSEVESARPEDSAPDAAQRMLRLRIGALPILDEGKLVGIVTETNLMMAFEDLCRRRLGACDDLVRYHLAELGKEAHPATSLGDALDLLAGEPTGHLLVTDGGKLAGIVSERDVLLGIARSRIPGARGAATVGDVMSSPPVTVEPGTPMSRAVRTMLGRRFSALPVMEPGRLPLGLLTQRKILEHYASVA